VSNRDLTIRFLGDSKGLVRAAKDAISGLDDTQTKAQAVAKALVRMADQSEAEMRDAASAADALGAAIGDELRAEIVQAGGSIDKYVADLKRAGLTYDEIRADADALGDALKRTAQAGKTVGDDINVGAKTASDGLDKVAERGDNSRSVLANMVGNSTQDLGELGGVAGTAGMALGQLAEYATEGNISLKGLSGIAGPMVGVAAAVILVTKVVGEMQKASEDAKQEIANLRKVQDDLADGKYEDAAKTLADQYKNTARDLAKYGHSAKDVVAAISGQGDVIEELNVRLDEASTAYDSLSLAAANGDEEAIALQESYGAQMDELAGLIKTMGGAQAEYAKLRQETNEATGIQKDFEDALKGTNKSLGTVDRSAQDFTDTVDAAAEATRNLDAAYQALTGILDQEESWERLGEAMFYYAQDTDRSTAETREYIRTLGEMVTTLDGIPEEQQVKLLAQLADGDVAVVEEYLRKLRMGVTVPLRFAGQGSVGFEKRAKGGPVSAGQPYLVGEQGPELVVPSGNGTVIPAGKTASMMGGGMGGGGMTINITTGADPQAVVAAIKKYERSNGTNWRS
jgi:hypothetical protein